MAQLNIVLVNKVDINPFRREGSGLGVGLIFVNPALSFRIEAILRVSSTIFNGKKVAKADKHDETPGCTRLNKEGVSLSDADTAMRATTPVPCSVRAPEKRLDKIAKSGQVDLYIG